MYGLDSIVEFSEDGGVNGSTSTRLAYPESRPSLPVAKRRLPLLPGSSILEDPATSGSDANLAAEDYASTSTRTGTGSQILEAITVATNQNNNVNNNVQKRVRLTIPLASRCGDEDESGWSPPSDPEYNPKNHYLKRRSAVAGLSPNSSLSIGAVM